MSSPVAIFIYNRPEKLKNLLFSIKNNKKSDSLKYFIFSDGFKGKDDKKDVLKCREIIKNFFKGQEYNLIEQERNIGLAISIINGVTQVLKNNSSIIVLEDDLELDPNFFDFMDFNLKKYQSKKDVYSINAHMYYDENLIRANTSFFLPCISSWGWGTWADRWNGFLDFKSIKENLNLDKKKFPQFNLNNSYPFSKILLKTNYNKIDSWAIYWYLYVFSNNGLNLFPPTTLVLNKGFDGSGSNTLINLKQNLKNKEYPFFTSKNIEVLEENLEIYKSLISIYLNPNIFKKIIIKFKYKLKSILR